MLLANGSLFCEDGVFRRLDIQLQGQVITALGEHLPCDAQEVVDAQGCYVVPGLVDIHIHGAMGADFSDGTPQAIQTMARFLLSQGVTSFLGTSMALPGERLAAIYRTARPLVNRSAAPMATLRGINMEGPFFNVEKRGAQNEKYIIPADLDLFSRLNEASGHHIRTVAVAPEVPGNLDFIREVSPLCHVSLAHSCGDFNTAATAFSYGADHVTHLFNGMPPFHHRDPGIVGAAADSNAFVELISDGVHLHPSVVRSMFKLFGSRRVCLISDAMRACGMPDGQYDLGGKTVTVANGSATIDNGSLAGSVTVLTHCLRRCVGFGVPLENALQAATLTPARSVGLDGEVGSLTLGKRGDVLLLNPDLSLNAVVFGGVLLPKA